MELAPQRYFHAVVVDYDGTIARSGVPSESALAAIDEARAGGLRVILATGRILGELIEVFPDVAEHFDVIVAEDGTVLQRYGRQRRLAPPVPEELTDALAQEGIAFRRGHVALACRGEDDAAILAAVRHLGLDCQLVRNRSELMVLPPSCSKGTGTLAALAELDLSPHNAVAIGDAENDLSLLDASEVGVAVGDAVESLKAHADLVLGPADGEGVAELLRSGLGSGTWRMRPRRWSIELGRAADGTPAELPASHLGLLVTGGSGSGKSYMAGLITERLIAMAYSVLLIDPEGDHVELGQLPGVFVTGAQDPLADPSALARFLGHRLGSVVLDLSALDGDAARAEHLRPLPTALETQHRRTGHPHWVIVDEAHTVLGEGHEQAVFVDRATTGYCFVTYRPQDLAPEVLLGLDAVVAIPYRSEAPELLADLVAATGSLERAHAAELLEASGPGEAVLVRRDRPGWGLRFTHSCRATPHVRHWHKYDDERLPLDRRFHFRHGPDELTGATAGSLDGLGRELSRCAAGTIVHHCRGGDLSRWLADVLGEWHVAAEVAGIEGSVASGRTGADEARSMLVGVLARARGPADDGVDRGDEGRWVGR